MKKSAIGLLVVVAIVAVAAIGYFTLQEEEVQVSDLPVDVTCPTMASVLLISSIMGGYLDSSAHTSMVRSIRIGDGELAGPRVGTGRPGA